MSSLTTDIIFAEALKSNATLLTTISNRLYGTAIQMPDEEAENTPAPYVILTFDGLTNDGTTKDSFEGDTDTVTIGIELCATSRPALGALAEMIRTTIREYFEANRNDDRVPEDYQFSAGPVQYDSMKPCFWQTMTYACTSNV